MILRILNRINFVIFFLFLSISFSNANFKEIKKKAVVKNPEIIFPIQKDKKGCIKD